MTETGIWSQQEADKYHASSPMLARWLAHHFQKDQTVIDFGCGNGFYCAELERFGFTTVGIEGGRLNNSLHNNVLIHDLTLPLKLEHIGSVLCLETGEHLPKSGEQNLLDTIAYHCESDLVMSWATPGQPGVGHINNQPHEYIISEVEKRGFKYLDNVSLEARRNADNHTSWFQRNLMVFKR